MTVANRPTLIVPKVLQDIAARSQLALARRREATGSDSAACGTMRYERSAEIVAEGHRCAGKANVELETAPALLTRLRSAYRQRMGKPASDGDSSEPASAAPTAERDERLARILAHTAGQRWPKQD